MSRSEEQAWRETLGRGYRPEAETRDWAAMTELLGGTPQPPPRHGARRWLRWRLPGIVLLGIGLYFFTPEPAPADRAQLSEYAFPVAIPPVVTAIKPGLGGRRKVASPHPSADKIAPIHSIPRTATSLMTQPPNRLIAQPPNRPTAQLPNRPTFPLPTAHPNDPPRLFTRPPDYHLLQVRKKLQHLINEPEFSEPAVPPNGLYPPVRDRF